MLGSRTIRIPLVRTASAKANREAGDLAQWPSDRRALVDDLWALALLHLAEVEGLYREAVPAELAGRELEPWRLILTMARLVDRHAGTEHYRDMLALALAKRDESHDSGEVSDEVRLLRALVRLVLWQGEARLAASEIGDEIERQAGVSAHGEPEDGVSISDAKIGKLLVTLQLRRSGSKHHGARRQHQIDPRAVAARAEAYGVRVSTHPAGQSTERGTGGTDGDGWDGRDRPSGMTDETLLNDRDEHVDVNYDEEWPDGRAPF